MIKLKIIFNLVKPNINLGYGVNQMLNNITGLKLQDQVI